MEKRLTIAGLLVLFSACLWAETSVDLFKAGNALYAEGKFMDAAQKYQAAADGSFKNWTLEFNLANAYWRSGQPGKAVLHYERAFRLNPGQSDVLYNLNLASNKVGDPALPSSALPALAWRLFYLLSVDTLTLFCSLLFLALCAFGGMALVGRTLMKTEAAAGLGLFFLALAAWLGVRVYLLEHPQGVVVAQVAEVRSGPSTTYPASFTIPEGHRVLILEEQEPVQGWLEVGVPQEGLKGWIPEAAVEVI